MQQYDDASSNDLLGQDGHSEEIVSPSTVFHNIQLDIPSLYAPLL
jgi:hypothetical protein